MPVQEEQQREQQQQQRQEQEQQEREQQQQQQQTPPTPPVHQTDEPAIAPDAPLNNAPDIPTTNTVTGETQGMTAEMEMMENFNKLILGHMQEQFSKTLSNTTTDIAEHPELSKEMSALIERLVSQSIMQVQPIIMNSVSHACSKMFCIMMAFMKEDSELKRQTVQPVQTTPPPTQNDNSIMTDMRKQLRLQSYQNVQQEQEDRSDTIRLKGVDYVEQGEL